MTEPDAERPAVRIRNGTATTRVPNRRLRVHRQTHDSATKASAHALREWHHLTPAERTEAWTDLVDWVAWLHDRYELSVETRLPHCWPAHPGLVEELWALKVWREEIWGKDQGTGQAARYWHSELRAVVQAAATTYAPGCRAGHRGAELIATSPGLADGWGTADPLVGVDPRRLPKPTGQDTGTREDTLDDSHITAALATGTAKPLSALIPGFAHLDGHWWTKTDDTWLKVTDPAFASELDNSATRMAAADAADRIARHLSGHDSPHQ